MQALFVSPLKNKILEILNQTQHPDLFINCKNLLYHRENLSSIPLQDAMQDQDIPINFQKYSRFFLDRNLIII